ncbi:hypothetical protein Bbelb_165030 [Branchiostoma belcheri]|nr:hypothetical protein Bbelb_165030 [Branchiostoma belcheri]
MDDLSEACMNPVSLDTGSREASSTQADEVGHFYITSSYEEGYDHYYDDNLAVVSEAADEIGQTDNINPAGNPNCDVEICQDDMEGWETDVEETTPKTALDNDNGNDITTSLSRCYNAPESSAQIPSCVGGNSNICDIQHTPSGLYQNPSCEQDTRNPNHVYTQDDIGLNPMYMLYQQDTQDPNQMYVPKTGQDYAQSTTNPSPTIQPNVLIEPASGLPSSDDSCSIQSCTPPDPHHGTLANGRDDNIPTANSSSFVESDSTIPTSGHSASCRPPNQMRTRNALIPNPMYVLNVGQQETTCALPTWCTYRRLGVIVTTVAFMALLVFCITFAGLYFTANVQDVKKNGPDDVTSCNANDTINDVHPPNINTINDVHPPNINTIKDVHPPNINTTKDVHPPNINTIKDVHPPNINTIKDVHPPNINTTKDVHNQT